VETYVMDKMIDYEKPWTDEEIEAFDPAAMISTYAHHPSFTGCFFNDEPGTESFPWMSRIMNKFEKETGYSSLINLLPGYANAAQLRFGANAAKIDYYDTDPKIFENYCEEYCKQFSSDILCTDIYPLDWTQYGIKRTRRHYVEYINQSAKIAHRYGRKFWCCIQTYGYHAGKRTPNEAEFRWQCYCVLSFGCTGILLWNYLGRPEFPALVHPVTLVPNDSYYHCQTAMWEMRNLSDTYMQYKYLGSFNMNDDGRVEYLHMSEPYEDFDGIHDIKSDDALLFGCFEKKQGKGKAFTVVNMNEFKDEKSAALKFKTKAKKVTVYRKNEFYTLTPQRGVYTIDLECGEGVFVMLD
ncbi:MAG: hypothetical protein IJO52_06070, partial [Clostridia bacterium]|nr:hypothetical protein [Clostridia bacterium]